MADRSAIEWTTATWNPMTGCTKVSEGCRHCYAERLSERLQKMGNRKYARGFEVTLHTDALRIPRKWLRPRMVFVDSMGDLLHEQVPLAFINNVILTMEETPQHVYQILTKRADRLTQVSKMLNWPRNAWLGVTVEDATESWRIEALRGIRATVRFVSFEPLLGPVDGLSLNGIDWAIVGGESGPGARPMDASWARDIRDECARSGVAFFFKQWGGVRRTAAGRQLDGRTWDEMPDTKDRIVRGELAASAT